MFLKSETLYRIDTIELRDGCYPRITYDVGAYSGNDGVRSPPPTEGYSVSDLKVEPALWGIILILDRVCVDVKRRRFSWATTSVGKLDDEGTEDPSCRTHYADDARYEYDDNMDELFNLADQLITISHSRGNSTRESHEEQSSLIRILYCCILPKILIYQKDHKKVEDAIKNQMSYIRKIEHDIERDSQDLNKLYQLLCKQQDDRLQQFTCIAAERKCTMKFVSYLDADLKKREHKLREQIDANQGIVQQLKDDIQKNGETEEKRCQLENARKLSAHLHMILQKVLIARVDTIQGALESEDFQLHDNETVVVEYFKSKELIAKQKNLATRQMEKKVRATSILENLKRIKEDIAQNEGVASATVTSTSGVRPTDVFSDLHIPEYQTLSERVADILNNLEHPLGEEFAKFTREICECCQGILDDPGSWKEHNGRKRNTLKPDNGYLVIDNDGTMQEEYLIPLEKLCERIREHSDRMAQLFLEQFNSSSDIVKHKLQLCYEENFYNEVGGDIAKIYEKAFSKYKEKMIHDLELLSTYPINCLDLGMKDEWWLELFEKRRQATIARHRSASNPGPMLGSLAESEASSTASISSRSSGSEKDSQASTKDRQNTQVSCKKHRKRSSGKVLSSLISFIRRKSKEVSDSFGEENIPDEKRTGKIPSDTCYDNYHDDTEYHASKMSGAIKPRITNGTNHIDHPCSVNENDTSTSSESGMCVDEESGASKLETPQYDTELSKFAKYFGPSLDCLKDVFDVSPVFSKLKCLTKSLTKVTEAVQELRQQELERVDVDNDFSIAITADDLLPLMVLIMLQMEAVDAASMVVQLKMMQDLIPKFLSFGCHGWALVEFDMASKVLQSLCTQFDWSTSFSKSF